MPADPADPARADPAGAGPARADPVRAEQAGAAPGWSLVIPVKVLARAKSRLAALAGPHRAALALAMAADTVTAAVACQSAAGVIVVTDDLRAAAALADAGAVIVADQPGRGLNP
ncbi:MAG: 2-phospho-L-lactate guanylyltransferase, partial [Actinobacteria bacterium]|nr:2-phospho-L-lactate guanylyltransferase [Actinomycetota bacterium]